MSKLTWGAPGSREYELGVDRGVFYPRGLDSPVAWNGLVKVQEAPDIDSNTEVYIEGIKILNIPGAEEFAGTIDAFSYPQKLVQYDGFADIGTVLYIGQQPRKVFDFSYRTKVGNDVFGSDYGYKLHLVYNVLLQPATRDYGTLSSGTELLTYNWAFSTTPLIIPGLRPSAHLVVTSHNADFIGALEDILYGTAFSNPRMPKPQEVMALLEVFSGGSYNYRGVLYADFDRYMNLATNPSFETTSGTVEVFRNLATNPSFETSTSTTEVRRNYATNPVASNSWTFNFGTGGAGSVIIEASPSFDGGFCCKGTWSAATTAPSTSYANSNATVTMDVGETWTLVYKVAVNNPAHLPTLVSLGGVNTPVRTVVDSGQVSVGGGIYLIWTTYKITSLGAGTGACMPFVIFPGTPPIGFQCWVGGALFEKSPVRRAWFSGTHSPDSDLAASWTGAENNSASVLHGDSAVNVEPSDGYSSIVFRSSAWKGHGSTSLCILPISSGNNSGAIVAGSTWFMTGYGVTFVAGKTYTVAATFRMASAQTGTLATRARRIYVGVNTGSGFAMLAQSDAAPNEAGVARLSVTFTVPAGATGCYVLLFNGASAGNGDVWWDDLMIVEAPYNVQYFNGDINPDPDMTASWTGTAHQSASILTGVAVTSTSAGNGSSASAVTSQQWASTGARSLRVIPRGAASNSITFVAGSTVSLTGYGVTFVAGKTYTVAATFRMASAQTGTLDTRARRIYVGVNTGSGPVILAQSDAAPNEAGVARLSVTFTVPAGATGCFVFLFNGASAGNGDVWWDDVLIVPEVYNGEWFNTIIPVGSNNGDAFMIDGQIWALEDGFWNLKS